MLRISLGLCVAFLALLVIDRFFFSFGKIQLFGLWVMQEQTKGLSAIGVQVDSQQIISNNQAKYATEIAEMLATYEENSLQSKVAMTFADYVKNDVKVQMQLQVIARQHPDKKVRCYWQQQLQQGVHITIVNNPGDNQRVSNYLMLPETDCPINTVNKPITIDSALN